MQNFFENTTREAIRREDLIHETASENIAGSQHEHVWRKCEEVPGLKDFIESHPEYFELLRQIESYDPRTFEHCIKTFGIAKLKLEENLGYGIVLSNKIKEENMVSTEEYLGACLLHDFGKTKIPKFILDSSISDAQWIDVFLDNYSEKPDNGLLHSISIQEHLRISDEMFITIHDDDEEIMKKKSVLKEILTNHEVRMVKYAPIKWGCDSILGDNSFSEDDMQELKRMGISGNLPLLDIIKSHEKYSSELLCEAGMKKEARLAGMHHDYEGKYKKEANDYPFTVSSFRISTILSEFIKLADMKDAITRKRPYNNNNTNIEALFQILKDVQNRKIHFFVAYLWISAEIRELERDDTLDRENISNSQSKHLRQIYSYLEKVGKIIDKHLDLPQEELPKVA